jgi:hypothetical protein
VGVGGCEKREESKWVKMKMALGALRLDSQIFHFNEEGCTALNDFTAFGF